MKKYLLLVFSTLLLAASCDSSKEKTKEDDAIAVEKVPASVITNFSTKYPIATGVIWESAHEGEKASYKAKFLHNGKKWKAEFTEDGQFIKEKEDD